MRSALVMSVCRLTKVYAFDGQIAARGDRADRTVAVFEVPGIPSPHQPDAPPSHGRQAVHSTASRVPPAPRCREHLPESSSSVVAKSTRQAQHRAAQVIGRQRLALASPPRRPLRRRQATGEARLGLDYDAGAAGGGQPRIANTLQRVAEPLFVMEQQCLAGERLLAAPSGTARFGLWARHSYLRQPSSIIASAQAGDRVVGVRQSEIRIDLGRDAETCRAAAKRLRAAWAMPRLL